MTIREQILEDIKTAMKQKDNFRRDTLRLLNSAIKQVEVDERVEMTDERVLEILQTQVKRRVDSIEQYTKCGREDLAKAEEDEMKIISEYLPKQLDDTELETKIKDIIAEIGASSVKDIGNVSKLARERLGATCDAKRIGECAKKLLM